MTFSKDQIQALVAEIDGVLQKPTSRLPWVSGEATQQRRVLERVRNYLVALQKHLPIAQERSLSRTDLLSYDISYQQTQPSGAANPQNAQQMLQVVMQEMAQMRSSLMQPLQADLNAMQQQREALRQEIQQLEGQRRSYGLSQPGQQAQQANQPLINDFLQVLMGRLQESIPQQVAQSLSGTGSASLTADGSRTAYGSVEQLRSPSTQSDQLILNLDSTLRVVFEALQRDVNAYQESLAQGLDRMHSLGQQSEMMFNALITHLAQQLGREASTYLQASGQLPDPAATAPGYPSLPPQPLPPPPAPQPDPLPGAALSPTASPLEASSVDRAIDSWLQSMGSPSPVSSAPLPPSTAPGSSAGSAPPSIDFTTPPPSVAPRPSSARPLPEDPTDIDAALRLLQQLSANLDAPTTIPATPLATSSLKPPDTLDGLDEFYELFGGDLDTPGVTPEQSALSPGVTTSPAIATPGAEDLTGQAAGFAGIEASGSFDPTHGWDLLPEQSVQPSPAVAPPRTVSSTAIDPADQIHSLDDLFEQLPSIDSSAPPSSVPIVSESTAPSTLSPSEEHQLFVTDDDRYIPAAPEESLLPSSDQREAPHQEFWLDDLDLTRLSEDLFSLESREAASQPDRSEPSGEFGMTLTESARTLEDDATVDRPPSLSHPPAVSEAAPPEPAPPEVARSLPPVNQESGQEPVSASPAISTPGTADQSFAFSLDDLFDTEALPSPPPPTVSATPVSVSDSFAFTLEGMDDLFADVPGPTTTPIPPPDSSPPTIDEPLGFTLEGMDDLFADLSTLESVSPPAPETSEKNSQST